MKTDAQLRDDVMNALAYEPAVDAARIDVEVHGGAVTLSGPVRSLAESWYAQRAVTRLEGVQALTIDIDVQLPVENRRDDEDISRTARHVLQWATALAKEHVEVEVEGGWLTLTGEVSWDHERRAAEAAVRLLAGLRGVTDLIRVKAHVSRSAVKTDVDAALRRLAAGSAPRLVIEVHGAQVTLSGEVHDWAERVLAQRSAWGSPGVYNVVDRMTVER
jgi:osmotically-inducible protein OsmY